MENVFIVFEKGSAPGFIKAAGVIGGIMGGLVLLFAGLILSMVAYYNRTDFHGVEVALFIVSFGLLTTGAHTLDLIEKDKKRRRIALAKVNA